MAYWLPSQTGSAAIWDPLSRGEVINLFFNFFEGSNEGIIGREAERRSSMVKCEETPLEGVGM